MGRQSIPQAVRQVIDEWLVAEAVLTSPIDSVLFYWIPAVRTEDQYASAGFRNANHLGHDESIVCDMFDHLVAQNEVECRVRERKSLADALNNAVGSWSCWLKRPKASR